VESVAWDLRPITVSIGASTMDNIANSVEEVVRAADASLYRAKSSGRNCLVYTPLVSGLSDGPQMPEPVSIQ
jgi:diguanylate cyclase (GGDEF)-like protein